MLALHEDLMASIHEKEDSRRLAPAFKEEIRRRVKEIDSGKAEGVDPFKKLRFGKPARKIKFSRENGFLVASTGRKITMAQTRVLMDEFP